MSVRHAPSCDRGVDSTARCTCGLASEPQQNIADALEGQWHKIVYLLLRKLGMREVLIRPGEINRALCADPMNVGVEETAEGVRVFVLSDAEATALMASRADVKVKR